LFASKIWFHASECHDGSPGWAHLAVVCSFQTCSKPVSFLLCPAETHTHTHTHTHTNTHTYKHPVHLEHLGALVCNSSLYCWFQAFAGIRHSNCILGAWSSCPPLG
jgi:hypothetical protein